MTNTMLSVRVDTALKRRMRGRKEINWSEVIRNSIEEKLIEDHHVDRDKAKQAVSRMDCAVRSNTFVFEKGSLEVIKEWRRKRR